MKNYIFLFILLSSAFISHAQDQHDNERVRQQRLAYISVRLDLNTNEAAFFSEKYNEYEDDRKAIAQTFRQQARNPRDNKEANEVIEARLKMEEDLLALKRQFYNEVKTNISPLKLMELPEAEKEFKKILLRRLRTERRGGRG